MDAAIPTKRVSRHICNADLCYVAVDESKRASWGDTRSESRFHRARRLRVAPPSRCERPAIPGGPADRRATAWKTGPRRKTSMACAVGCGLSARGLHGRVRILYRIQPNVSVPADAPICGRGASSRICCGVAVEEYIAHMKVRSPKWGTVALPSAAFQQIARRSLVHA